MGAGCSDQFVLDEINIESDPELLNKYRYDIPVISMLLANENVRFS